MSVTVHFYSYFKRADGLPQTAEEVAPAARSRVAAKLFATSELAAMRTRRSSPSESITSRDYALKEGMKCRYSNRAGG